MTQHHQVEVTTRALDSFLEPRPPRRLDGEEARARLRVLLRDDLAPPAPEDEDLPARVLVAWRLARAMARILGICAEDELLDVATEQQPSPWLHPLKPKLSPAQQTVLRRGAAAELLGYAAEGLSLLPPAGEDAPALQRWCYAMTLIAGELGVERSEEGLRGMQGMLHPRTCLLSGVTEAHVLAVEELLVDEAQRLVIETGERAAVEHFRERYGFARKEAVGLVRLARADFLALSGSSMEEDRAMMVAQLKDLAARAKEEMNSDKELKALKHLAMILGLTRTEPEDRAADFMKVIAAVAARQDGLLGAPQRPFLEPRLRTLEPSEYTVIEQVANVDDEESLAEFDKENASRST